MNEVDNMHQDDINKDLGHYIKEKHKSTPFWKKVFKERSKQEVQEEIKEELMEAEQNEDIHPEDKKELEERIKEEEKLLNPQKFKSQQSFLEGLKQDSLSGQVIQSRQDIQKDKQHLTPQGLVESYDKDGQK